VDKTLHLHPSTGDITIGAPGQPPADPGLTEAAWDLIRRLPRYARVVASMVADERVPISAKGMLLAAGAYLVSPIDAIPGIIPIAGQLDDLYVVLTGLQLAVRVSPPEVAREHFNAVGLEPAIVDDDLASIRRFVRQGVRWTLKRSGDLMSRASRQMSALATRIGQRGETQHDQESRQQGPATSEPRSDAGSGAGS
jgi:uncharacterized membrane protein YkvA (DUF1232 family)